MADKSFTLTSGTDSVVLTNPVILYGATPNYIKGSQKTVETLDGSWHTFDRGNTLVEVELPFKRLEPSQYTELLDFFMDTLVFKGNTFSVTLIGLEYIDLGNGFGEDIASCHLNVESLGEMFTRKAPDHYDMNLKLRYILEAQ